jgi:hypothetical protein
VNYGYACEDGEVVLTNPVQTLTHVPNNNFNGWSVENAVFVPDTVGTTALQATVCGPEGTVYKPCKTVTFVPRAPATQFGDTEHSEYQSVADTCDALSSSSESSGPAGELLGVTGGTCQSTGNPNTRRIQHTITASNVSMPSGWSYDDVDIPEVEVDCLAHHDVMVQNITFYDAAHTAMNSITGVSIQHNARCMCNGCPPDSTCAGDAACLACLGRCRTCVSQNTDCHGISECVPDQCPGGASTRLLNGSCLNCSAPPPTPPAPSGGLTEPQVPMFKLYVNWCEASSVVPSPNTNLELSEPQIPMFKLYVPWCEPISTVPAPNSNLELSEPQTPMFKLYVPWCSPVSTVPSPNTGLELGEPQVPMFVEVP